MRRGNPQLPLAVQLRDDATLENFLPLGAAAAAVQALRGQCGKDGEPLLFLHGGPGSGKSHLLQAACHLAGEDSLYLPLAELAGHPPGEILAGLDTLDLVALDDLQVVLGGRDWELALFDLCNRARGAGCRLLMAADAPPRRLAVALPDLGSRLSWGVVYRLPAPGDADKQSILRFRAGRRGLLMPEDVAAYIVARAPRETGRLLALLELLDRRSLAEQRALSVPFVKQALGW